MSSSKAATIHKLLEKYLGTEEFLVEQMQTLHREGIAAQVLKGNRYDKNMMVPFKRTITDKEIAKESPELTYSMHREFVLAQPNPLDDLRDRVRNFNLT